MCIFIHCGRNNRYKIQINNMLIELQHDHPETSEIQLYRERQNQIQPKGCHVEIKHHKHLPTAWADLPMHE